MSLNVEIEFAAMWFKADTYMSLVHAERMHAFQMAMKLNAKQFITPYMMNCLSSSIERGVE